MKLFLAALLAVVVLLAGGIVLLTGDFLGEDPAPPPAPVSASDQLVRPEPLAPTLSMNGELLSPGLIARGEEAARHSQWLAAIVTDAPLEFAPEDNLVKSPGPAAYPLFLKLEFAKLIEKFGLTPEAAPAAEKADFAAVVEQVADPARAAELLSQVTARRSLSNRTSYRCVVEVSFYYGDDYRPYHMALGQGSDFCYGLGLKTYHICSPQAVLEGFEALLLEK